MEKLIYLDNAATTKTAPEVVEAMLPYFTEYYGNPSSVYGFAAGNKEVITRQRETIAEIIGAEANEIYFTAGGSESDNWALKATAECYENKGRHIITTKIEHHAILHTAEYLEKKGFEVTYLDVDEKGLVDLEQLRAAIRPDTILISVMFANNEIGTIQPIKEIGEIAQEHGILFHTDAVQAFCQVPINVDECHIDMLSASGHKINGPKGIGFLYIRKGVKIRSFVHGGAQERKRRAGTENVPGIVGLGTAAKRAAESMEARTKKEVELRDYFINRILTEIPYSRLNGHESKRLPNNTNFSFQFIEGESLLIMLDILPDCISCRFDHHTPFYTCVINQLRFLYHIRVPLCKIIFHGSDRFYEFFVFRHTFLLLFFVPCKAHPTNRLRSFFVHGSLLFYIFDRE